MVMYSNKSSVKESVMGITNVVRTNAIRIAWVMFATVPIAWLINAAQAGEPFDTPPHKVVSFRDLNLNSAEGVAVLYNRIRSAAHEVCADPDRWDLSEMKLRPCIDDAVARAVAQVNRPMLTSLYQAKGGKVDKKVTTLAQAH
jgi:UrcA family protein